MSNTTNYNLNKPTYGTRNWDIPLNQNFDVIDSTMKSIDDKIGNLDNSTTTDKSSIVNITNEINSKVDSHLADKTKHIINILDYGAYSQTETGYETFDSTTAINNALLAAKGNKLIIPDGIFGYTPPLNIPSNTIIEFTANAWLKANTTASQIIGPESGASNILLLNPHLDGDNIRGLNGLGFSSNISNHVRDITVINPIVKNCLRSAVTGGGRAFAFQNGVDNVKIISPSAFNCTSGYDFNGNSTSIKPVKGIFISDAYAEGCQEAVSAYSDGTTSTIDVDTIQATITSLFVRNCGRTTDTTLYSGSGVAGDKDGGVIVSRRGRNIIINKLSVFNDSNYTIGGLFRGTGNNIQILDFDFYGNADALFVIGSADNLLPLTATNDASHFIKGRGRFYGTISTLLEHRINNTGTIVGFDFDITAINGFTGNILTTIASNFGTTSTLKITDQANGRTGYGNFSTIYTELNTLQLITQNCMYAGTIKVLGDVQIGTNGRIDFSTTSAGAGAAEGYILVKVAGVTKKIPYHAV